MDAYRELLEQSDPDVARAIAGEEARQRRGVELLPSENYSDVGRIDFDELRRMARETRPKIVLCGYTSYPRDHD